MRFIILFIISILPLSAVAQAVPSGVQSSTLCVQAYGFGNYADAIIECGIAAHSGNPEAMVMMAGMYYEGLGIKQDYVEAANWYQKAADMGWPDAQFSLGKMYEKGHGVEQNYNKAFSFYMKAERHGHLFAIYNIGYFHAKGYTGERDFKKAYKYFKRAAKRNHGISMYGISTLHSAGIGIPRDLKRSYMWGALASKYGVVEADKRLQYLAEIMSEREVEQAKKMAEAWDKSNQARLAGIEDGEEKDAVESELSE